MRTTIVAARVLGIVLMFWGATLLAWSIHRIVRHPKWGAGKVYDNFLEAEQYQNLLTQPLVNIGLGMLLLVAASILDELRRRPE